MTENLVSRQEFELLEAIREGGEAEEYKLSVRHDRGEWLIEQSSFPHSDDCKARGVGRTFGEAWAALETLAIEPLTSPPRPPR